MIMLAMESIEMEPQINADERRLNALSLDNIGVAFKLIDSIGNDASVTKELDLR